MPCFLERDEAIRRELRAPYAWDGGAEVRPFGTGGQESCGGGLLVIEGNGG